MSVSRCSRRPTSTVAEPSNDVTNVGTSYTLLMHDIPNALCADNPNRRRSHWSPTSTSRKTIKRHDFSCLTPIDTFRCLEM